MDYRICNAEDADKDAIISAESRDDWRLPRDVI
jgi:hypothetical protein